MKKNRIVQFASFCIFLAAPFALHAQSADLSYFEDFLEDFGDLLTTLLPILVAIALVVFIWGLVVFIAKSGDEKAKEEGKNKMVWGVLALFVIVAVVGLVELLKTMFGIGDTTGLTPPALLGGWLFKKHD